MLNKHDRIFDLIDLFNPKRIPDDNESLQIFHSKVRPNIKELNI